MADDTLTVSEPMTIAQIEAKYPDHCIYIVDRQDDPETGQMIGGRVAAVGRDRDEMYAKARPYFRKWRKSGTLYTQGRNPTLDSSYLITSFVVGHDDQA